jgi:transposase|tara:strand:- start:818 stop:1210 length:393 start_codon:yes stop_codon:yes gene_type:complete
MSNLKISLKMKQKRSSESLVRDIKRKTRRKFSSEEKIRIVIDGLRGEVSIAELCRREGIAQNLYYRWSKDFMESGKKRLSGDTMREANTTEVQALSLFLSNQIIVAHGGTIDNGNNKDKGAFVKIIIPIN